MCIRDRFDILGKSGLYTFTPALQKVAKILDGKNFTAFDIASASRIVVGTTDGYLDWNPSTKKTTMNAKLPACLLYTSRCV